jgi:hypothetical protein
MEPTQGMIRQPELDVATGEHIVPEHADAAHRGLVYPEYVAGSQ